MDKVTSKNYAEILKAFEAAATPMGDYPTFQAEARALAERIEIELRQSLKRPTASL